MEVSGLCIEAVPKEGSCREVRERFVRCDRNRGACGEGRHLRRGGWLRKSLKALENLENDEEMGRKGDLEPNFGWISRCASLQAVEQEVVATVDAIEKEDLIEENMSLEKAKEVLASAWSVLAPLVIPGIFIALYAVLASFGAPPPEPCLGAEAEAVRKAMGRAERPKTAKATMDPWDREKAKTMVGVGTGAMALVAVLSSQPVSGFVPTISLQVKPAKQVQLARAQAPRASKGVGRTALAQGVVAVAVVAAGQRRMARKAKVTCMASGEITGANPLHVIISGAGVGGLLLAKALSKEPTIKVTLLEQAW